MNGSILTKFERKDAEIFYLKSSFEEYFALKKVPHYYYDYNDFLNYASKKHPRIKYLIAKFGNPYEIDPTVTGNFNQPAKQASKTQYVNVKLIALTGKSVGKAPISKKFMCSTGINPIKIVAAKLFGLDSKSIFVSIKIDENSEI